MRRAVVLGVLLFAVYAATIGMRAFGATDFAGTEAHHLLVAKSLVDDRDANLADQYAARSYESFYPYDLVEKGSSRDGILYEPFGVGVGLLVALPFGIAGTTGVELVLAALMALTMALAYRLALRTVPDPWAIGATAAAGLSAPVLAYSTAVYPDVPAALALTAAALLAVRLDERVSRREAFGCFALLGSLPWLGIEFIPAGVVVGAFASRSIARARRRTLALGSSELAFFSIALWVGINEAFYDSPIPSGSIADGTATGAGGYPDRAYRLIALLVDRDAGLLRWAPLYALLFAGLWALYRSRRDGLSRAVPQLRAGERTATLCAIVPAVQLAVAAFAAPTMFGAWFPGRHLVAALPMAVPLVAIGLRRVPRLGTALAALSLGATVWLSIAVRFGSDGLVRPLPDAPFGPALKVLPSFDQGGVVAYVLAGAVAVVLAGLAALEAWRWREPATAAR